ncbi:hypothetical protein [Streptomyces sp. S.PNR 29]|uniref:hypothetical protein n=1 Tax=Streptomyces sp. S.PNR 29 TaxID=2973805 RepID=UPI0025AF55B1|nr:hypothetical protein [Streptomyces sp. S.PNR 29]MDN0195122.1 hypothetical protein [Streptomyces sp. S.PNR 29]
MYLSRSLASATFAVALVMSVPYQAMPHARVPAGKTGPRPAELFGATCWIRTTGSQVTAYCHNPYPDTDRVRLHIECARWWDIDSDGSPVDAEPAQTVRLTGRCWKEVGSVWVSHRKAS